MSNAWAALVIVLWLVVLILIALVLSLFRQFGEIYLGRRDARARDGLPLRAKAPYWEGMDHRGRKISSVDFAGRPFVAVFAEPTCGPCKKVMPDVRAFAGTHKHDLSVIVIGSDDEYENEKMADRFNLSSPIVTQVDRHVATLFNVVATPFIHVIDSEGRVREKGIIGSRSDLEEKSLVVLGNPARERIFA